MAMLMFAFLFPFLTFTQALGCALLVLLLTAFILPSLDVDLSPSGREASGASGRNGMLAYPLSVLVLVLFYRHYPYVVAAVWGIMALGDGMASVAGQVLRGPALPWNRQKTWAGFACFVLAGTLGAYVLTRWVAPDLDADFALRAGAATALVGAVVESLPISLDDNISVPLVGGAFLYCLSFVEQQAFWSNYPFLRRRILLAVAVNLVFALMVLALKWADLSGAAMGFLLGVAVYMGYGYKSFLILLAFVLLGSVATRAGYAKKSARGIAEHRRGARSWREALANCLAPAFFSLLAITTFPQAAFLLAFLSSVAEAAGDTVSSEIGQWLAGRTYMITTFDPAPIGEDGGVSLAGTAAGMAASALVVGLGLGLGMCGPHALAGAGIALAAAVAGNLLDSVLGATLERKGLITNGIVNFSGTSFAGAIALAFSLNIHRI
ncbi:MAG TPA: DUF92 domain-containing protein [Terriglobia bacterium]|nr:DUF92 domain-containing protein [Terriglobia bacterium]